MSVIFGLAVYLVFWWLTLFMVLPWGITRVKRGDLLPGEDPGSPAEPQLLKKFLITTGVSLIFFLIFFIVYESGIISVR